jgi:acyl-CoA reductase-like NAD-dependent aldehyde dehydrogenase
MSLIRNQAFVDGKWVSAASGKMFDVTNPATGQVIGQVPDLDDKDAEIAVKAAYNAFQTWEYTTAKVHSTY